MNNHPPAYRGTDSYTFVCYAHSNSESVFPIIEALQHAEHNIWYDEGIAPGSSWTEELANAIAGCSQFLVMISPDSVRSPYCLDEINFALEHNINIVVVHLEDTELPAGLKLSLNRRQAILKHKVNDTVFFQKLDAALRSTTNSINATLDIVRPKNSNRMPIILGIVMCLLLIVGGVLYAINPFTDSEPSVLLLPFDDPGLAEELSYLPSSLNNDLIGRLSRTPNLKIIAPISAQNLSESGQSIEEMATAAGVEHVLTGSIQSAADKVRINASLIKVSDGSIIWSDQFEGSANNLFEVQAQFAASIAKALKLQLDEELFALMQESGTMNLEAFDLMLQNMAIVKKKDSSKGETIIANFKRAVELDPEFTDAWAGLSITSEINKFLNLAESNALEYAERAYRLDPENPRALRAMGFVRMSTDPSLALGYFDKALVKMPQNSIMHTDRAIALNNLGRHEEAITALEHANKLDPLNEFSSGNLVSTLNQLNRKEEALVEAHRIVELLPNSPHARLFLSRALALAADPFDSLVESVRALENNPLIKAEAGFILQLIQYNQVDAAKAWQQFFMERDPNPIIGSMQGRIAKASGNITGLNNFIAELPSEMDPKFKLPLDAAIEMMTADVTIDEKQRATLQQQAYDKLNAAEQLAPIPHQPASTLGHFILLTKKYGDESTINKLMGRFKKFPNLDLYATERAIGKLTSGNDELIFTAIEALATRGKLNIPLLTELGFFGENRDLLGELGDEKRLNKALELQQGFNERLTQRAVEEFPKLLGPE